MACSEELVIRIRRRLARRKNVEEKQMFGGVAFLLQGNMCVGVWQEALIVRVGPEAYEAALREPFVRKFDITGKPMTGWVLVDAVGIADDDLLRDWIQRGVAFAKSLPAK